MLGRLGGIRGTWVTFAAILVLFESCSRENRFPEPGSRRYGELVSAFYVGLAGLQTGEDSRAKTKLTEASQLAPGEPAVWADLALLSVRQQDFDTGFNFAETARKLAPQNARVEALVGLMESKRGRLPEALAHLKNAVALDGSNLKASYALAEQTERQAAPGSDAEALKLFSQTLQHQPDNLALQLDVARLSAKLGERPTLSAALEHLDRAATGWPEEARQRLATVRQVADGPNIKAAAVQVAFLRNVLARVPDYRQSLNAVKTPAAFVSEPFVSFLKLPNPSAEPAAVDAGLKYVLRKSSGESEWTAALPLDDTGKIHTVTASSSALSIANGARLALPAHGSGLSRHGVAAADLNYDFKTDFVIATAGGVRIYQQQSPDHFSDISLKTKLPPDILNAAYTGAWAFDIDLDGDLDILLSRPSADPIVLRNNGDGTFAVLHPFPSLSGLVSFAAADIDGDGDPDVAMVDSQGHLQVFANERFGKYRARTMPSGLTGHFLEVVAGDINGDGSPDFVALRDDGSVVRLSDRNSGADWDVGELVKAGDPKLTSATANLILADFDNNGSLDILAGDGRLFLSDGHHFTPTIVPSGVTITGAVDLDNDGHLALVGSQGGKPVELRSQLTKNYQWQTLRLRAAKAVGDQRINSFGIGGEVEIRSGLLAQKQVITSPILHFGLGTHSQTEVARIVWPNGSVQAEFELKADQSVLAEQRLKGSCPFLFAWDGKQVRFVKDGEPWSPALGLRINAQSVARIDQTREWFKIPGASLAQHDGYYDLRVTAELWEDFYIDHYSLIAVDHPADTEIYIDERFAVPSPPLKIYTVAKPQSFQCAFDDHGKDVSAMVGKLDQTYLDTFGRGRYQGVTRDHWVELELPASAPRSGPLYLIGAGWMHPTDGTINVALGQNSDPAPRGLSIEVPQANGTWIVARAGLGFLAGRSKTMVLDISGIFRPGAPRKLRLRTNLEIYWDQLAWAAGAPDQSNRITRAALTKADLQYRGFSTISVANESSPEIPDYNRVEGTVQKWRDLEGYCTRFGDVRELLDHVDDRLVIMNAGDELRLRFAAIAPPPTGWTRDYVMVGDGWVKDGDYNSLYSRTVLPLPYHAMPGYTRAPSTLEDDPAYRLHPDDWQFFHTRYVTSDPFRYALRNYAQ